MIHASLFSGIGGPEVAAAMLGWENAFHCEINPFGKAVLDYWFPDSVSYEDITKTDFTQWRGRIDVLTGGFPCQPFSYAGKRGGREDERYLWPEMLRAIDEIRPTWVIGENVAGITTMVEGGVLSDMGGETPLFQEGDDFHRYSLEQSFTIERICRDLERAGYSVQPMLIPAAATGAPHRRDRVFIIAHVTDTDRSNDLRESGEHERERAKKRVQERNEVREPGKPNHVRPTTEREASADSNCHGVEERMDSGDEREMFGAEGEGGKNSISKQVQCAEANGIRRSTAYTDRNRGGEVHEHVQPRQPNGTELVCDGGKRDASDTYSKRFQESQQPGRREDSEEEGARLDDRTFGLSSDGRNASDTIGEGLEGENNPRSEETGRTGLRGDASGCHWANDRGLLPEERWRNFPTVSPVHRGNDGIPIRLDDLSISFPQWRTESLKAYGNAIVPQVMYRIFQAIKEVES